MGVPSAPEVEATAKPASLEDPALPAFDEVEAVGTEAEVPTAPDVGVEVEVASMASEARVLPPSPVAPCVDPADPVPLPVAMSSIAPLFLAPPVFPLASPSVVVSRPQSPCPHMVKSDSQKSLESDVDDALQQLLRGIGKPTSKVDGVAVSMTVHQLDYKSLMANANLRDTFIKNVKETIAKEASNFILPEHVHLELSEGSVVIRAKIIPPRNDLATSVLSTLGSSVSIAGSIVASVKAIPGIEQAVKGTLEVSKVSVTETKKDDGISESRLLSAAEMVLAKMASHLSTIEGTL